MVSFFSYIKTTALSTCKHFQIQKVVLTKESQIILKQQAAMKVIDLLQLIVLVTSLPLTAVNQIDALPGPSQMLTVVLNVFATKKEQLKY